MLPRISEYEARSVARYLAGIIYLPIFVWHVVARMFYYRAHSLSSTSYYISTFSPSPGYLQCDFVWSTYGVCILYILGSLHFLLYNIFVIIILCSLASLYFLILELQKVLLYSTAYKREQVNDLFSPRVRDMLKAFDIS